MLFIIYVKLNCFNKLYGKSFFFVVRSNYLSFVFEEGNIVYRKVCRDG